MQTIAPITAPAVTETLEDMLAEFAAHIDIRPASLATYLNGIRQFWKWMRSCGAGLAGREAMIAWRESLLQTCKPGTIKIYLSSVRRFITWATATGRMAQSAADGVKSVKAPRQSKDFKKDCLTEAQAHELLASVNQDSLTGKRDYALLALMLTCGLRDIEVARARICDLHIVAGQSALAIQGKGRDDKDAHVKLPPPVEKAIRLYLKERKATDGNAPLFASLSNRNADNALTTRSISRIVKTRLQAIGLDSDRLTAHSLRHTAATIALLADTPLEEVQALLRHASITTTMIYSHHISWSGRQAEVRIADRIF